MGKIIDNEGQVITFYHGTPGNAFNEFDLSKSRRDRLEYDEMYFFAFEKEIAENYTDGIGAIIKAYITANKTFDTVKNKQDKEIYDRLIQDRINNDEIVYTQGSAGEGYSSEQTFSYPNNWVQDYENNYPYYENSEWLADEVKKLGYDAFITSEGNAALGLAVFNKNQIEIIADRKD